MKAKQNPSQTDQEQFQATVAQIKSQLPTPDVVANLAVILAAADIGAGRAPTDQAMKRFVNVSIDIWLASNADLNRRFHENLENELSPTPQLPFSVDEWRDSRYPMTWEYFGRLVCPYSRVEDRFKWIKDFRAAEAIAAPQLETLEEFTGLSRRFLAWRAAHAAAKAVGKPAAA